MSQKVIQVAGFSNSGKTTLVEKLVDFLSTEGYKVGTIKHHGHGGELTSLDDGKDSWKHRQAGAFVSSAVSKGTLQLHVNQDADWEANEIVKLYEQFTIDVVVIEGFKMSGFPKLVLIKEECDLKLLTSLTNICCVVSWFPLEKVSKEETITYFDINEEEKYLHFILKKLRG